MYDLKLNGKPANDRNKIHDGDTVSITPRNGIRKNIQYVHITVNGKLIRLVKGKVLYMLYRLFPFSGNTRDGKYGFILNGKKALVSDEANDGDTVEIIRISDI